MRNRIWVFFIHWLHIKTREKNSTLIHPIYVDIYSDILLNSIATNVIASFLFPSIEFCSDISRLKEKCNIIEQ